MLIGDRLRELRDQKKMSQVDVARKTGLVGPYISRVENGYTVPSLETLEKFARALEVPLYQLFYDGEELPESPVRRKLTATGRLEWGSAGKDARLLAQLRRHLAGMSEGRRRLLLHILQSMARKK